MASVTKEKFQKKIENLKVRHLAPRLIEMNITFMFIMNLLLYANMNPFLGEEKL